MSRTPCVSCRSLRRKCPPECVLAPYFPADNPGQFLSVHRVYGKAHVEKHMKELQEWQRQDAARSLAFEAEARLRDPVYGCIGLISMLQEQLSQIKADVDEAKKELAAYVSPEMMDYQIANPSAAIASLQQGGGTVREPQEHEFLAVAPQQQQEEMMTHNSGVEVVGGGEIPPSLILFDNVCQLQKQAQQVEFPTK